MLLIKTTYPNKPRECKKFILWLIGGKLAACVNRINGVKSYYMWEGKIQSSPELILLIKTLSEKKEKCIAYIKKNHPYDTPEISVLEITETDEIYENWMKDSLLGERK